MWTNQYIGLSYKDYNCAEFVKFVLKKEKNIDLIFPFDMPTRVDKQSEMILKQFKYYLDNTPTKTPNEFDLVVMSARKKFNHIGLYVNIKGEDYVLHSVSKLAHSCLHKIKDLKTFGLHLEGFYKWISFTGNH